MPELPEVETIRRDLAAAIVARRIIDVAVLDSKLVHGTAPERFRERLTGARLRGTARRGKYLVLRLDRGLLVLHLMMSGRLQLRATAEPLPHTRLVIEFDRGPVLHFIDVRRFGRAWLVSEREAEGLFARLGPEPLTAEFDWRDLRAGFAGRRVAVKPALLDQRAVAGLGNIYADEALWLARIHPGTPAGSLRAPKLRALAEALVTVLHEGIAHGGTSFRAYLNSEGKPGAHQHRLNVFRRTGQPCPRCGRPVRRIVLGQRSTHFCANCQRRPRGRIRSG